MFDKRGTGETDPPDIKTDVASSLYWIVRFNGCVLCTVSTCCACVRREWVTSSKTHTVTTANRHISENSIRCHIGEFSFARAVTLAIFKKTQDRVRYVEISISKY